jgi:hypothetical protein
MRRLLMNLIIVAAFFVAVALVISIAYFIEMAMQGAGR